MMEGQQVGSEIICVERGGGRRRGGRREGKTVNKAERRDQHRTEIDKEGRDRCGRVNVS